MNFAAENSLAARLRSGTFSLLIEYDAPPSEQPFESATASGAALAGRAAAEDLVAGVAITDRLAGEDAHDPVAVAHAVADASEGKPLLLHISGKGSDENRIRDLLARAASSGIRNILAVTGDRSDRHPQRRLGRMPKHPAGYHDSVATLQIAKDTGMGFHAAGGVNPYKYNPADQYLQYYKMMRKLAAGADFLVTQAGWDMKKLQELQWYLQMRETDVPVIARIALLSPNEIARIQDGLFPGVTVSRSFAAMLQRESSINATQSLAAQLQRIGLQIAGCRLLGYSGVQVRGIADDAVLQMVLSRAKQAMDQFRTYQEWLAAWNEFHAGLQFAPAMSAYYVFAGLLSPDRQMYDASACKLTDRTFPAPAKRDLWRAAMMRHLQSRAWPDGMRTAVKKVLCGHCVTCSEDCRHAFYMCPRACPKGLVHGACGGSGVTGDCEFGQGVCFFHRVLAVAAKRHELDLLEKGCDT